MPSSSFLTHSEISERYVRNSRDSVFSLEKFTFHEQIIQDVQMIYVFIRKCFVSIFVYHNTKGKKKIR